VGGVLGEPELAIGPGRDRGWPLRYRRQRELGDHPRHRRGWALGAHPPARRDGDEPADQQDDHGAERQTARAHHRDSPRHQQPSGPRLGARLGQLALALGERRLQLGDRAARHLSPTPAITLAPGPSCRPGVGPSSARGQTYRDGYALEQLRLLFPTLKARELEAAIRYYELNRERIDRYL